MLIKVSSSLSFCLSPFLSYFISELKPQEGTLFLNKVSSAKQGISLQIPITGAIQGAVCPRVKRLKSIQGAVCLRVKQLAEIWTGQGIKWDTGKRKLSPEEEKQPQKGRVWRKVEGGRKGENSRGWNISDKDTSVPNTLICGISQRWLPSEQRSENQSQISGSPTLYTFSRTVTDSVAECKIESLLGGWVN